MRDSQGGRRASHLDTNSSLIHHDRASMGAREIASKPRSARQSEMGMRPPGAISPPPLKRQRTAYEPSCISDAGRLSGPPRSFYSFPAPPVHHVQKDRPRSRSSLGGHSSSPKRSAKSHVSCKPACRVCDKTTATSYNPIITCPRCARSYHDSCRRPPLAPGVDPGRWRCSACLNNGGKPAKPARPALSSLSAPIKPSVVSDIFKPRSAQPLPTAVPSGLPRKSTQKKETPRTSTPDVNTIDDSTEIQESYHTSQQPEPKYPERLEVPNTPTQRTSQLNIPDRSSEQHDVQACSGVSVFESSASVHKRTPLTAICLFCRKQTIPARPGDKSPQCQSCRTKLRMEKMNQLEIPETPDSVIPSTVPAPTSSAAAGNLMPSAAVTNSVEKPGPVSWFHPSRTTLKSNIRKVGDGTSRAFTPSHDYLLEPTYTTEVISATDEVEQKVITQPVQLKEAIAPLDCDIFQLPHDEVQTDAGDQPLPLSPNRKQVDEPIVSVSSTSPEIEDVRPTFFPQWYIEKESAITMPTTPSERPESEHVRLEDPSDKVDLFPPPQISGGLNMENSTSSLYEKRYTNRELARIALACANGSRMTALQIIDWVVLRFSYLQKGQGAWERSLKLVLSISKEFSSERTAGSHEARAMYGFASAAFRTQYEREYCDYITSQLQQEDPQAQHQQKSIVPPASAVDSGCDLERHVKATPTLHSKVTLKKAIKSAPIRSAKSSSRKAFKSAPSLRNFAATPAASDPSTVASPASISSNDSPLLNPFESSRTPFVKDTASQTQETKHETSIHSVYPRDMKPSIETMTEEEKAVKITEIRARPSRKQFFDSNHRLAHVRRYGRQDIHDESDGAWRPQIVEAKQKRSTWRNDTITDDFDANQSLRSAFNLPANAIPMNDGNELAFRDGTLVHGRLPRSRHIYRVGKRLGTGLTVN